MLGRTLNNRYHLIEKLGDGGMAQVYKAQDTVLNRMVAVKVLREQYASDQRFLERFRREAQAAANLNHPNVVNIFDVGQDGGIYYIVMEYVDGPTLKDLIAAQAPFTVNQATSTAIQILSALGYAHEQGLVHRDMKPQNILVTKSGRVKVADFGIAKGLADVSLTEAGIALGTVHYFSPEQAKGEGADSRSDIYSVGVILYEMLTGTLPFEGDTAVGVALKHIEESPNPPSQLNPNIPPQLQGIILTAMAKDPAQRFQNAEAMVDALRNYQTAGAQQTVAVPIGAMSGPGPTKINSSATRPMGPGPRPAPSFATAAGSARSTLPPMREPYVESRKSSSSCLMLALGFLGLAGVLGIALIIFWLIPNLSAAGFFSQSTPTGSAGGVPSTVATPTPVATPVPAEPTATQPSKVQVPDLKGKPSEEAKAALEAASLSINVSGSTNDDQIPEGSVVSQTPGAGEQADRGSTVNVVLSSGPRQIIMPNVINTSFDDASKALQDAGINVVREDRPSKDVPAGVVMDQTPAANTPITSGSSVTLVVSAGDLVAVPDVFGMSEKAATDAIKKAGLVVGSVNYQTQKDMPPGVDIDIVKPGQVLSAQPDFKTMVPRGSTVDLAVRKPGGD